MNKELFHKVSIYVLFFHAFIELLIIILRFLFPNILINFLGENPFFMSYIKLMYALTRLIVGLGVWKRKLWAIFLGILVSLASMILAPIILPFGLIDLPLALLAIFLLIYIIVGNKALKIGDDLSYLKIDS
ncbi:MAG: conserved membrane protein of unknown function [Promethearchaeota archaeon]|nr:MAG: conserved membrane protein of unknown function [Candidatus Lokiarchaeota archaeon]